MMTACALRTGTCGCALHSIHDFAYSAKVYAMCCVVSTSMSSTLLKSESPELLKTLFRLNEKLLTCNRLPSHQSSLIIQRLAWFAERMYQLGYTSRSQHIFKALRAAPPRSHSGNGALLRFGNEPSKFLQDPGSNGFYEKGIAL